MDKLRCFFGLHKYYTLVVTFKPDDPEKDLIDLYYPVCEHCNAGNPFITGEF